MSEETLAPAGQTAQGNTVAAATAGSPPSTEGKPETPPLMAETTQPGNGTAGGSAGEGAGNKPVMAEDTKETKETKPEDGADPKGKDQAVPDYFADVTLPEGMVLDREATPKAAELFGKYKLPKEAAQEFVDLTVAMRQREAQAAQASQTETVRKMAEEIRNRPQFKEELPIVKLGINNLAKDNPRIRDLYNDPVFGNMPELWDIALAVGRRFESEGQLLSGGRDNGAPKNFIDDLYPNMKNEQ